MFYQMVKRVAIDICEFMALLLGILFYYFKMRSFINAAIVLGYVNGQTVSYLIFATMLLILPCLLLSCFRKLDKGSILRWYFYLMAATIFAGTVFDVITYNWFIGYKFIEGDAIFVNLMWNMPNMLGVSLSLIISILYLFLGKQIKRKRRISFILLVLIFLFSTIPPLAYSLITTGSFPRDTYLQKSLYVIAIQIFILAAFAISASSRTLWKQHIWN